MGNFCTKCGRPLAEGEICNCQSQSAPQPQQTTTPPPQPMAPPKENIVKKGFQNMWEALKTLFKNPAEAAAVLAKEENWLVAIILSGVQALFMGLLALAYTGRHLHANSLSMLLAFLSAFIISLALSAILMGASFGMGKALKGTLSFRKSLSLMGIRSFVLLPFTLLGLILGLIHIVPVIILCLLAELLTVLFLFIVLPDSFQLSVNRAFVVILTTFAVMILFGVAYRYSGSSYSPTPFNYNYSRDYDSSKNWEDALEDELEDQLEDSLKDIFN